MCRQSDYANIHTYVFAKHNSNVYILYPKNAAVSDTSL